LMNLYDNPGYRAVAEQMKKELAKQRKEYNVPDAVLAPPYVDHRLIKR
jgi:hypothetical protein